MYFIFITLHSCMDFMSFYLHFKRFPLMLLLADKFFSSVYFCGGVYFIFNLETCTQWVRIYGFSFVAFLRAYKCHQPFCWLPSFLIGSLLSHKRFHCLNFLLHLLPSSSILFYFLILRCLNTMCVCV